MTKCNEKFTHNLIKEHEKKLKEKQPLQQQVTTSRTIKKINSQTMPDTTNIINMCKVQLGQQHLKVLSKELKFVLTPGAISTVTTILNCEQALYSTPTLIKNATTPEISPFIQKWKKPKKCNMNKEEMKMLNEIKSIEDIVIVQVDKSEKIVIMNKIEEKN
ncbi:unnamed protein product [Didymodactylos carnosus]|uniref:Uncharacterized protein n=1 Tax=Didymodactylos carnosus TaxID=1234261 RepID=A0A815XL59_9BILA|nr:unnamed protein product [Didymodactylos carnosus]CAF1578951.1 unnamed protein product [Didymodactylos carnosus]CAF4377555.1 unnamed protein product [Didymodactylos carnosus]CAF4420120.1 unnamed protein product [Didymodactylos carnosus]